jgi:molybdopterin-guanine dinucleotide biosynthesis protein
VYVNVAAILEGGVAAPEPDILPLADESHLFYSGEFNLVFGDTESGKTWLCLAAVADRLEKGGRAAYIDLDHNGAASIIKRLQHFGIEDSALVDQQRFRLAEPHDSVELKEVVTDLTTFEPDIVVIASLGEVLPLFRLKSNDADDFTMAHTGVIKPLTRCGAAVLVVDHLAKNADSRNFGPTGTTAKSRAVGGTSVRVTAEEPFKPGEGGSAKLELYKDRHGGVRRQFPKSEPKPVIGTFTITDDDGDLTYSINSGLTVSMAKQKAINAEHAESDAERIAELADGDFDMSVRSVRQLLKCGQARAQRAMDAYRARYTRLVS